MTSNLWWAAAIALTLIVQIVCVYQAPPAVVPVVYWLAGVVALVGHLWMWWSDDMD